MREGQAAVFLDRDGVINEEVGYLDRLEKLRLIPGAARAIRLLNENGIKAVVVTNQSGVARGLFDETLLGIVHMRLREMLRLEARDYGRLTALCLAVAAEHAGGRLVSLLEGGYHLQALADSCCAHVQALLQAD